MITVHMIGNAHIDPVWLWRWPAGMGEVLATCRTACDMLDEDPAPVFTRSDVWVYQIIEEIDHALFQRIRGHVKAGRWAIVGGWYVQPDCNLPREESFRKHIESGQRYFADRFGLAVTTGYNVDSFGHAASLPRILAEGGYDSYVMMRPMAHEKTLPAGLFRWRSTVEAGGVREVVTWRIAGGYCTSAEDLGDHVKKALAAAAPGVDHVMCFYGVGDHGGGPTREQVTWIKANAASIPGARMVFSHPRAFFNAVLPQRSRLPVVEGELQMHAIGCYSVGRAIKRSARLAEHALVMAEQGLAVLGLDKPPSAELDRAWEKLMFSQFHDTYGGTAIPSACEDAVAQLAAARDTAEQILYRALYRHSTALPPHRSQRIVAFNASSAPFDGWLEHDPWLGDGKKLNHWLADESGGVVRTQVISSPAVANLPGVLLWHARLLPGQVPTRGGNSHGADPACFASRTVRAAGRWRAAPGSVWWSSMTPATRGHTVSIAMREQ
jgi:alpha-mannosidase